MEHKELDTAQIRAGLTGPVDLTATVVELCDALDTATAALREARRALEVREGDARRAATRLEIAQRARTAAEVERSRSQVVLNNVRTECHRVLADPRAGVELRELVRVVLGALGGADRSANRALPRRESR